MTLLVDRFTEEMERYAIERGFFPVPTLYGLQIRDHNSTDMFWFNRHGEWYRTYFDTDLGFEVRVPGHDSQATIRAELKEWMDAREHTAG